MFSFLQTAKKDVSRAANDVVSAGKKTLNFIDPPKQPKQKPQPSTLKVTQATSPTISQQPSTPASKPNISVNADSSTQNIKVGNEAVAPTKSKVTAATKPKGDWKDVVEGAGSGVANAFHDIADIVPAAVGQVKAVTPHPLDHFIDALRGGTQKAIDAPLTAFDKAQQNAGFKDVNNKPTTTAGRKAQVAGEALVDIPQAVNGVKDLAVAAKNAPELIRSGVQAAKNAPEAARVLASKFSGGASKLVKAFDEQASNVASRHPAVQAINDHLQQLSQHRDQLVANNASHVAVAANDSAYKNALKARDDTIKAIKEGGFAGSGNDVPGVSNDTKQLLKDALQGRGQALDDLEAAGGKDAVTTATPRPGVEIPKSSAEIANQTLPSKAQLPSEVVDLLGKTGKAIDSGVKAPVLEGARDPQSVLSKHFGKEGSDIAYDASVGAKTRSDLQTEAKPLIDAAQKALKQTAKTDVGRADVESRINQALEDRSNVDKYLKNDKEKAAYEATAKFYDHYQGKLSAAGKGTLENYSPRVARQNAAAASEGLDRSVTQAFSKNTDAKFLKERTKDIPDQALLEKPVSIMHNYSSAVSKQLAYEDMMKKLPERLQNVKPIYTQDQTSKQRGTQYLQKYMQDLLQPDIPTSGKGLGKVISEQTQNKLIAQTYKSNLRLSPKFGITNRTQGFATQSQVSKSARSLARKFDKSTIDDLKGSITTGDNPISGEAGTSASNAGGSKTKLDKVQAKLSGEQKNVDHAFRAGVAQHIVDSPIYKQALKDGLKPAEAAKKALADPDTKELAIRAGNVVTNTTQFGGNIANKPGWLRDSGTMLGLSKKWYQQYQRFPLGMMQLAGNITNPKNARAVDIMRRGDPAQTKLVDYLKAAQTLQNALPDAKKAIKAGETTVTKEQYQQSKQLLDTAVKTLNKEIKNASQVRAGKSAKSFAKMWAAAGVIQYLYSDLTGTATQKAAPTSTKIANAGRYSSPVTIPTKDQNPLVPSVPASPVTKNGVSTKKLLNFVPVIGPLVNRGREFEGLVKALTGSN